MEKQIDAIIVLGGGRFGEDKPAQGIKKGDLTPLSKDRLDAGDQLFKDLLPENPNLKIFALGENRSTYAPTAIKFNKPGCNLRKDYFAIHDISEKSIVTVNGGIDTISEAFCCRVTCRELGIKNVLLVTSINHEPRALWIFKRIFGDDIKIEAPDKKYLCEDKLNPEEEREIFALTQQFFEDKFRDSPIPDQNMGVWFEDNHEFYDSQAEIHTRFMKEGKGHKDAYEGSGRKKN